MNNKDHSLCDGLAWLGFWICVGMINFQSCSMPKFIQGTAEYFKK